MCLREDLMIPMTFLGLALAAGLSAGASAHAQGAPTPTRPDPLNPAAAVPAAAHATALARYRSAADVKVGSWREANDAVTRIGGWRVYAREAAQPEAATAPAPAASQPPSGSVRP
jgi:hypothetical protein